MKGTKSEKIVKLLMDLGHRRSEAKVIAYFLINEEAWSRQIERAMFLGQPEVSPTLIKLTKEGILKVELKKEAGKGRPRKVYHRTGDREIIFKFIQKPVLQEIENTKQKLSELKDFVEISKDNSKNVLFPDSLKKS